MTVIPNQLEVRTFDTREFRRALGSFPTGVAIITTRDADGTPLGLTCNSFSSVSLDPPLVLWSLRSNSRSLNAFRNAKAFAINILGEDQRALSAHFASNVEKKFEGIDLDGDGLPLVSGSIAHFSCRTAAEHEAGDHVIFIGQVESFTHHEQDPLVFYRGAYKMITDSMHELATGGLDSTTALNEAREQIYGVILRMACERATSEDVLAIEAKLREIDHCAESGAMKQRAQAALEFFHLICAAAHNPILDVVAQSLGNLMKQKVNTSASAMTWAQLHQPALTPIRWRILDGIKQRNAAIALAGLSEYVQASPISTWEFQTTLR